MPKLMLCGRGGSGKSTLVVLLAKELAGCGLVLVVDADESNLELCVMLGLESPACTVMDYLGGKQVVGAKLMDRLRGEGDEELWLFDGDLTMENTPGDCSSRNGTMSMVRIGKIEHSMEGCACPMGVVARSFLKSITVKDGQWVLVDTEAGIEHFGRGVLEGADCVLVIVDPSQEAVVLAEKACRLAEEAEKPCGIVLNKVNEEVRPVLKEKLAEKGMSPLGVIPYSPLLAKANLNGDSLKDESLREELHQILNFVGSNLES